METVMKHLSMVILMTLKNEFALKSQNSDLENDSNENGEYTHEQ